MEPTKGFLQATVIVLWAVYVVAQIVTSAAGSAALDPTAGVGLIEGFLGSLPFGTLGLATAVLAGSLVALEAAFAVIRRSRPG